MRYNLYSVIEVTEIMSVQNYIIFVFKYLFSNSQIQNIPLDNSASGSKDQNVTWTAVDHRSRVLLDVVRLSTDMRVAQIQDHFYFELFV